MNGVQTELNCKPNVKRCKRFVFPEYSPLLYHNTLKTKAIKLFQADHILTRFVFPPLREWWNVTDRESTLDIVQWLLEEGHHAEADRALAKIRKRGLENISAEEHCNGDDKMEDVCLIAEEMQKNGWCPAGQMPQSVIAWDLVRLVNLGRWAYLCDYIREDEMWHIMQVAADTALEHFSSWEEYGRSFIMGRGVWHGDPTDSETAYEIVELLLKNSESPWKQSMWKE